MAEIPPFMYGLSIEPLPIFRVALRVHNEIQYYEVEAENFEAARAYVAEGLGNQNVWCLAAKQDKVPVKRNTDFHHTPSPGRA